jgi:hypothetical protein
LSGKSGGGTNLFSLLEEHYAPYKTTRFTLYLSDNPRGRRRRGKLAFGDKPKDMNPDICLFQAVLQVDSEFVQALDGRHSPDTQTEFDNWYAQEFRHLVGQPNLPPPFASITHRWFQRNHNAVDPEPEIPNCGERRILSIRTMHHDAKYEIRSNPVAGGHGIRQHTIRLVP